MHIPVMSVISVLLLEIIYHYFEVFFKTVLDTDFLGNLNKLMTEAASSWYYIIHLPDFDEKASLILFIISYMKAFTLIYSEEQRREYVPGTL